MFGDLYWNPVCGQQTGQQMAVPQPALDGRPPDVVASAAFLLGHLPSVCRRPTKQSGSLRSPPRRRPHPEELLTFTKGTFLSVRNWGHF